MDQNISQNQKRSQSPSPQRSISPQPQSSSNLANTSPGNQIQITKSNLEKATKPLFNILRRMMDDLNKNINYASQNDQAISIPDLQNQCLSDYQKIYENYCYQLMKFTIEYSFTENEIKIPLGGSSKDGIKNKLQHMQMKRKNSLKVLMNKLFSAGQNKLGYEMTDSDEEGFFDGQSDRESITESQIQHIKINNVIAQSHNNLDEEWDNVAPLRRKLNDALQTIKDLEFKLKNREETVQVLTTGYVKDIQHMKEMLFRQAKVEDLEFYEVQYFDSSSIIDEKTRLILNDKLKDLKIQFDKKTQDLLKKIIVLSNEVERLKKLSNVGVSSESGIVEVIKKMFVLEESPYKIWKMFQDIKGNQYFFNVFEIQRPEYGINYKEVNKMLMCKKVYEKEYNDYKSQVDDQICNLITKTQAELTDIQQEVEEKDKIIEDLNQQLTKNLEEEKKKYVQHMQEILNQKEVELYEKHEKQIQELANNYEQEEIEKDRLRGVWLRWACVNRVMKCAKVDNMEVLKTEIKKILFNNSFQAEAELKIKKEIEKLQNENKELQGKIDEHNLEKLVTKQEVQSYIDRLNVLQSKLQQQISYVETIKSQNYELAAKKSIFDTALKQVYNKIGMKLSDQQFEDLDLDNEKKLTTKEFLKKIIKVDRKQFRAIRESSIAQEKIFEARNVLFQKGNIQTQEVQTCIFGVNTKYEDFMKQVENDLEDQGNPEEIERLRQQMEQEALEEQQRQNQNQVIEEEENQETKQEILTAEQMVQTDLLADKIKEYLQEITGLKDENYDLREQIEKFQNNQNDIKQQMETIKTQRDQAEKMLKENTSAEGLKNNQGTKQNSQSSSNTTNQQNAQQFQNQDTFAQSQQQKRENQNSQNNNAASAYNSPRKASYNKSSKIRDQESSQAAPSTNKQQKDENNNSQAFKSANSSNKKISKASNYRQSNSGVHDQNFNSQREPGTSNHSSIVNPRSSISKGDQNGASEFFLNKQGSSINNLTSNLLKNENGELIALNKEIQGDLTALRRQSNPEQSNQPYVVNSQEKSDDENMEEQAEYTNRDNSEDKPQNKLNDKSLKRAQLNQNTKKRNKKRVFERLFQDSKDKQDRMDELKKQLQKLETFHWEEVLSILNLYSRQLHEEFRESPEEYIRLEHNKSPRENQNAMNQSAIQNSNNSDAKRLNIRQNYPDVQAYTQNNKFPCINPSPIQGGRAEYYFKKQKELNYYNIRGSAQYPQQQQQQQMQQQSNQASVFPSERQQETDLSATFTELNQENYERRKQYLEQVFESFRKHTHRMQLGSRKEPNSEMKMAQNESLTSSRKKSFSHARPKTRDVSNFEENLYISSANINNAMTYQQNNHQNQMNSQHNTQIDSSLMQSNLYDEPYSSYQNNHRSEDPLKKIEQQIKKLKPINQQYKSQNSNQSHITPQDSARVQNSLLKDKYLQKIRQEISSANTSLNPKNRQNGQGENNVFLPESILNLVKKSKQQSQQNNIPAQQGFDYHY